MPRMVYLRLSSIFSHHFYLCICHKGIIMLMKFTGLWTNFRDTPTSLRIGTEKFTGVDYSTNLIKEIQLCSKMCYSIFYARVLHVCLTLFKLCFTNLVLNDQSSTGRVIKFLLGKGTRNSTIKFVTFLLKVFALCSRLCL